ncbi:MAG: glycerol kinase GlpK [Nitrososphaerota archaeon]|nr:glycerol kinase GlpK [Candidatus Calditenuaceae archaeon]MDW8072655.1 glycerol kinase GlpK [Nitrososphaerota archaeon]
MQYIVSIDQGTTGTRCLVINEEGRPVSWAYKEHANIYPRPGWVEHDPLEILEATKSVVGEALRGASIGDGRVVAIGVTNQRETTVLWDKRTGLPIYNAIVWQDTRTRGRCDELRARGLEEDPIHKVTGLYASTYFSATKVEWILKNIPKAAELAKTGWLAFGTIDTWLIWNMTRGLKSEGGGSHVTDYSNASRTMLFDIDRLDWSDELLELFGIPEQIMPTPLPSIYRDYYGYTNLWGQLDVEAPVCGDLGDQQAALFGQTCFEVGDAKNTYGTGCFLLQNIGERPILSRHGLLTTVAYGIERGKAVYAMEGSIAIAGSLIKWLAENIGVINSPKESGAVASMSGEEGSAGVYFVPAFSGLFAPYWDPSARGLIIGLTAYTRREHIVHAALESICWQTYDVVESIQNDTGVKLSKLRVDGGASMNDFLMQLQADVLGCDVVRPEFTELTSLGVAYAAGLASGVWEGMDELRRMWRASAVFQPRWAPEKREKGLRAWRRAIERSRNWLEGVEA